ncbi:large ribosomal subunit protein mL62-like [Tubulanus polymorphus]|uniref:large ribosomal subunit protein mL62-like n=1 Tax=Tubulanus polymorphus TaxID=672921 RepID=UPI003DA29107
MLRQIFSSFSLMRPASIVLPTVAEPGRLSVVGYKSQYNIERLYPQSNTGSGTPSEEAKKLPTSSEFTGFIPLDKLEFRYSRSSGPGGQHVNTTNSKVELRFHVKEAVWLNEDVKVKLAEKERNRINKDGFLILSSDRTRKQILNQADCLDKLRNMIRTASIKPAETSEDDLALKRKRQEKRRQEMLRQKKLHSLKKQSRQGSGFYDS